MTRVAVIGGGYAGMAAAVTLAARGVPVTVFEAARQLGGRARRVEQHGVALDNGLHILVGAYCETVRMVQLVNPGPSLMHLPLEWRIEDEFHLAAARLPAPLHLLIGLLRARGMDTAERWAVLRFLRMLRASHFELPHDVTVEQLLEERKQGEKLRRLLWRPLCVAALNTPSAMASARVFLHVLRDVFDARRAASDLVFARVDLSALFPDPAAVFVERHGGVVLRSRRVTSIDPIDGGFAVMSDGERAVFSHVVCAVSPHQVNAFLIGITALSEIADAVAGLEYQPIHSVWLQYPTRVALPSPMVGFSSGVLHWAFDRERLCGQRGLVGAVISAEGTHQQLTHDALGVEAHRQLERLLGALPGPLWIRVIAEKRATFACTPGLRRPPQATPLRNLFLAGDYTASDYPATLEAAVRSGIRCAELVLRSN